MIQKCELGFRKLRIDGIFGSHPLAIIRIAPDKGFDHSFLIFDEPHDYGIVEFLYLPVRHFLLEFFHGTVILRNEDETARILVEPMDDSGAFHAVYHREIAEVVEECIYERSRISEFTGNRMGIDSWVFTNDREILIIEDNLQIHIFRLEMGFFCLEFYFEDIPFLHSFITLENFPIYLKSSFFYELLHVGPGVIRKKGR